jgi:hypothetical protein
MTAPMAQTKSGMARKKFEKPPVKAACLPWYDSSNRQFYAVLTIYSRASRIRCDGSDQCHNVSVKRRTQENDRETQLAILSSAFLAAASVPTSPVSEAVHAYLTHPDPISTSLVQPNTQIGLPYFLQATVCFLDDWHISHARPKRHPANFDQSEDSIQPYLSLFDKSVEIMTRHS